MTKQDLIIELQAYQAFDNLEETHRLSTLFFLKHSAQNCYTRQNIWGHITGSCFLINADKTQTLFMHHAVLNDWFKMGGHCDGNENVLATALREGVEETGIEQITLLQPQIFDVDVHAIPFSAKRGEAAHLHYDITYICQTDNMNFVQNSESLALAWLTPEQALQKQDKPHYQRMIAKWQKLQT